MLWVWVWVWVSNDNTFHDFEWPLTPISRSRHFSTLNISETIRDRAIVTIERQWDVVCALSTGDIFNDLNGLLTWFSSSRHFWSQIFQKRCILGTKLLKSTNRKLYTIYRMIPLSTHLSDLWPRFQGHGITDGEYLNNNEMAVRYAALSACRKVHPWR